MVTWLRRLCSRNTRPARYVISALGLSLLLVMSGQAQTEELGDGSADPIKLFEQGQNAHAHGEFAKALEFYEQALKLRPEFPEAELQRGSALVSLNRLAEAEAAFRRAIELRKEWYLPHASLGVLLARANRAPEAESTLRQAIKLAPKDSLSLRTLAELRLRAGDAKEAAELARRATLDSEAPPSTWILLAMAQRSLGDKAAAKASLDHGLGEDPENVAGLIERADLRTADADYENAIQDLKVADRVKPGDRAVLARLLDLYQRTGKTEEVARLAQTLGIAGETTKVSTTGEIQVIGSPAEIEAANDSNSAKSRAALEVLLKKNPRNPMLLAKLGASYRTDDPAKSLEFYRRANELDPKNADYATGYAAALVQSRRFEDAVNILREVTASAPENYVAHANLATSLYELKRFNEAIAEYQWLLAAKPDLAVTYYFIATARDKMGEFQSALDAYEQFLSHADSKVNDLEIEKVKLRLPLLKRQIKLGQGTKRKPS
jgi:tetratricopeptide (TPR) repeat protein